MDKNLKLFSCAIYVCLNSKDNPEDVIIVVEYSDDKVKITKTNKKTKEKTEKFLQD